MNSDKVSFLHSRSNGFTEPVSDPGAIDENLCQWMIKTDIYHSSHTFLDVADT